MEVPTVLELRPTMVEYQARNKSLLEACSFSRSACKQFRNASAKIIPSGDALAFAVLHMLEP